MTQAKSPRSPAVAETAIAALMAADHSDPFAVLGPHPVDTGLAIRTVQPGAKAVRIESPDGAVLAEADRRHADGFFEAIVPKAKPGLRYLLAVDFPDGTVWKTEDPYRFWAVLGDMDIHLLGEGRMQAPYRVLGAHPREIDGVAGTAFAVWAPNAKRVSVVGSFNDWDGRRHPMRLRTEVGVWELFVPQVARGDIYKYEIKAADGRLLPLKADPMAARSEHPPATGSVVHGVPSREWQDTAWMDRRAAVNDRSAPVSIYEVHLGSWRRPDSPKPDGSPYLSYEELAHSLVAYVTDMGFTHVELLPVSEFPFDGSWGYQPTGMMATTIRHGPPEAFQTLIEACHAAGIGVLIDWVPGHFPTDPHGLAQFDGTNLYEHADPRQGFHQDWNTLIYNYGRTEVANFLLASARYWLDVHHIDGLRVDAVASMLYLDYSRNDGEWIPNKYGGRENLEAIDLLRRMNTDLFGDFPGATTAAEESTAWPGVSQPVYAGGLGFGYKWNMGWMHDTLRFMSKDPIHRGYHLNDMTFGLVYAFSENFILPLSHDEVVHGKGSILGKMPGDTWQQFANLRAYYSFMWTHPGKKLLFMGSEFGQGREWNHEAQLDWHLLDVDWHAGVQSLVRDLNRLYRSEPALHVKDCEADGFEWLEASDHQNVVLGYLRRGGPDDPPIMVVNNWTPMPRPDYRIGCPEGGRWRLILNSDAPVYAGSGAPVRETVAPEPGQHHDRPASLTLDLPPLATLIYRWEPA